ncbi:MAG: hypothetical protein KC561_01555 [Myxococcales bacterium]|nr:hypothetical protein [Myxococcales bacterium]
MAVEIKPVRSKQDRKAFVEFPFQIYRFDRNWVPPLNMEQYDLLNSEKHPWYEHGEAEFFLAYQDGKLVGRISAQVDKLHVERHDNTGFFGFYEAVDDTRVSKALFKAAEEWLRERKVDKIRGPFSLNINEYAGFLVDGWHYPPMILMTHNPPYYNDHVKRAGFGQVKDLYAWHYDILKDLPEMALPIAQKVMDYPGLVLRSFDMKNIDREVQIMQDIFNEAWINNWGYLPLTSSEVKKMSQDLKLILDPEAAIIAEVNGDPAGICFCLPNLNEVIQDLDGKLFPTGLLKVLWRTKVKNPKTVRLVAMGVRKKYRGSVLGGLSIAMYVDIHRRTKRLGYELGELGWTLEDNKKVNQGIEFMGGKVYKTYRVYEKSL